MTQTQTQETVWEWAARTIAGTYSSPQEAADKLRQAAKYCRLIGGASIAPFVDGHEVMITVIPIDRADTYPIRQSRKEQEEGIPRRRGIGKSTLMTISHAAGVEWQATQRVDDGADPNYYVYHVEGRYRGIDGQYRPVVGDKDLDLRAGSDQIAGKSEFEVQSLRATALRSAITKAKLRALREGFGVPHGVLEDEVDRPFVYAKLIFTGRSSNPQAAMMFSQVIAMQQLAATAAMYGGQLPNMQLPTMQLPAPEAPAALPAHTVVVHTVDGEVIDTPPARVSPPPSPAPQPAPPQAPQKPAKALWALWPWEPKRDGDPKKGAPLTECSDEQLTRLAEYCEKRAEGGGNFAGRDATLARAARDVLATRAPGALDADDGPDEDEHGGRPNDPNAY